VGGLEGALVWGLSSLLLSMRNCIAVSWKTMLLYTSSWALRGWGDFFFIVGTHS
jgi:hypothetical protein